MALTPIEEAMHLEAKILLMFEPKTHEERHIYKMALTEFLESHHKYILDILDKHLDTKAKE